MATTTMMTAAAATTDTSITDLVLARPYPASSWPSAWCSGD